MQSLLWPVHRTLYELAVTREDKPTSSRENQSMVEAVGIRINGLVIILADRTLWLLFASSAQRMPQKLFLFVQI